MHPLILAACCLVSGHIHTAEGDALAQVRVVLHGTTTVQATTDAHGDFSVHADPGTYNMDASVRGYAPVSVTAISVDHDIALDVALEPLDAPTLRTIGTVYVDGRLAPIQGAVPTIALTRADFARLGQMRSVEGLLAIPSVTFSRPDGGGANSIAAISLRGPDPSETLIALDGQLLNDANTGDVDVSRFPVAAFSATDVTEGLGPQDTEGSNTIGGAVNFLSLHPTRDPHYAFSLSAGSFGSTEGWYNMTGSQGKLGYAFGLVDQQQGGYVNQHELVYTQGVAPDCGTTNLNCPTSATHLGSTVSSRTGLVNLNWAFSQNADITARVFSLNNVRDQSSSINGIDGTAGSPTYGLFVGPGNQTFDQNIRAYQMRGRLPLGAGELVASASESNNDINVVGGTSNPMYDVIHKDKRSTGTLSWTRTFEHSNYSFGATTQYEYFNFIAPPPVPPTAPANLSPVLGQTINTFFARDEFDATDKLSVTASAYQSHYTTFGSNFDGRLGLIYASTPTTSLRFSFGTGFRAPLLIERYVFPYSQLTQDANGVWQGQGNPNEVPEHATEYELGASHRFSSDSTLDVSLYHTNLRDAIENYYPLAFATSAGTPCNNPAINSASNPNPNCISYPVNVGNVVYQGAEVRFAQRFPREHLFLLAQYGLNAAYPNNFAATVANPTSGGNLVNGAQFLGIPQQQGSLELDWTNDGWHAASQAIFRGNNNELSRTPFTLVNAAVGKSFSNGKFDLTLAGTNLFSDAAGRFTLFGGGVPYRGLVEGPTPGSTAFGNIPTDQLSIEPAGIRVIFTVKQ
jgi:outer membrane receptor protein involved in Fe transport